MKMRLKSTVRLSDCTFFFRLIEMLGIIDAEGYTEGHGEGIKEGRALGNNEMQNKLNQLTLLLSNAGRMDDIVKAAGDKDYQESLLEEFGL